MLPLIKFRLWTFGRTSWKSDATSFPLNVIEWYMILVSPFAGNVQFFPPACPCVCVCVCVCARACVRCSNPHKFMKIGLPNPRTGWAREGLGISWFVPSLPSITNSAPLLCLPLGGNCNDGNDSRFTEMHLQRWDIEKGKEDRWNAFADK